MTRPTIGIERFIIRAKHAWAVIFIDEKSGIFACYSSCGSYNYCWNHIGTQTLKEFLLDLDFDYFMTKTRGLAYLKFDADKTVEAVKQAIIERRRDGSRTKEFARACWTEVEGISGQSSHEFFEEFCASQPLMDLCGCDYYDLAREAPTHDALGFWQIIWPALLEQLREAQRWQI